MTPPSPDPAGRPDDSAVPPPYWIDFAAAVAAAEPGQDLVGVGLDLEVETLRQAYRAGVFPMGVGEGGAPPIGWWCPDPRGVILPGGLKVSRSLRRSCRRYRVTSDTAFDDVVAGCADPGREGRWITGAIAAAYRRLYDAGLAHSVEVWAGEELVGGLYGVGLGGLFAGESMFHRASDASKVALVALADLIGLDGPGSGPRLLDTQWTTDHLASLGAVDVSRADYLRRCGAAVAAPAPVWTPGEWSPPW